MIRSPTMKLKTAFVPTLSFSHGNLALMRRWIARNPTSLLIRAAHAQPAPITTQQELVQDSPARGMIRDLDTFFRDELDFPWGKTGFFGRGRDWMPSPLLRDMDSLIRRSSPRYDIAENEKGYKVAVEMPGVSANNVKVEVMPGTKEIRLRGERKSDDESYYFEKRFTLGSMIDLDKIKANVSNGVLVVTLPKDEKLLQVKDIKVTEEPETIANVKVEKQEKVG